jgi:hypothetical protein
VANKLWERQPGESEKAYRAFRAYLELPAGKRSIDEAAKSVGLTRRARVERSGSARAPSRVYAWSAENRWVERSAAFDAHVDAEDNEALIAERKMWRKQQRSITHAMAMRLTGALSRANFDLMSAGQIVSSLRVVIAMRNEALGMDNITEHDGGRPAGDVAMIPAIDLLDPAQYGVTPEILAATIAILDVHEHKPAPAAEEPDAPSEPAVEDPDSTGEPPASADPGGEIGDHDSEAGDAGEANAERVTQ